MSVPATPTASRRRPISQGSGTDGNENSGSWLGAIGGVMGELLQSWGILGALKRRGWGGAGARSTPNTPPPFSRSSSPVHEQIELSHLNIQCRESIEGGSSEGSRVGSPAENVRRRDRPRSRPPRHSFYEGSSPDSYMLTALLIHSLKHGSGKSCSEPHCHLCIGQKGASSSDSKLETHKNVLLDTKQWKKLGLDRTSLYSRSISEESTGSQLMDVSINPLLVSCDSTYNDFQLSFSPPHRTNSLYVSNSSCRSSKSSESLLDRNIESDVTLPDSSSLTDVTYSSDLLSISALSVHPDDTFLSSDTFLSVGDSDNVPSSETISSCKETDTSLSIQTDTGTLTGFLTGRTCCTSSFFGDDSYESATLTEDGFDLPRDRNPSMERQGSASPPFFELSSSVCSLPCRLGPRYDDAFERPMFSSGSLVMVPRRPSLTSPAGVPSSHFRWEEVREMHTEACSYVNDFSYRKQMFLDVGNDSGEHVSPSGAFYLILLFYTLIC